jgi:hypothetical protein
MSSECVAVVVVGDAFNISVPFSQEEKDYSPPLILNELRDLSEFRAAEAEFEVIIDKETDVKWVPAFIAGERVQFVAVGSVDATVDFSAIDDGAVVFDEESNTATITLQPPTIGDPVIDLDSSGVTNRDRGVLDRLGGIFVDNPTAEIELIREAADKISKAAAETDLLTEAEQNTVDMFTGLIEALGVDSVDVVFQTSESPPG